MIYSLIIGFLTLSMIVLVPLTRRAANRQVPVLRPIAAASSTPSSSPSPTPKSTPSPSPKPTATPSPVAKINQTSRGFGISSGGLDHFDQSELDDYFESLKSLGVKWVRYDIDWSVIQKDNSSSYNWSGVDRVVASAKSYGINSLGIITYTPRWASVQNCNAGPKCAPSDPSAFGKFAGQVALRYKDSVKNWQIWNEPNLASFMGPSSDVKKYADILRESYTQIRAVNPQAVVVTGGIAAAADGQDGSLSPLTFVQKLYGLGSKPYFDAIAMHPYSFPAAPSYPASWNSWQQINSIHQAMVANGDSAKKIWVTEYGAPTGGPGDMYTINQFSFDDGSDYMSEVAQEEMARQSANLYNQLGDWMGPFFWYTLIDKGTSRDTTENFFGLMRFDGSKKPAYEAFRAAFPASP